MTNTQHTQHSSYREILIEHLFVGEVMRTLWPRIRLEVLKPQVDDSGYDLVLEAKGVVRHVQLKSSFEGAATRKVKVSLALMEKPSACVIWVRFDPETLELRSFLWLGGRPGKRIRDLRAFRVAKHTRANAQGVKQERPNQRSIPRSEFDIIDNIDGLVSRLFGDFSAK